ncbi:hypothetical protein B296_00012953 [Ensete ventricosum]|uniref:Uncharacterized protein n=1 Tax=Ensete ventricosum TaxID=4639 RepID=A0A426YN45_ENSVE|nr:hypothetical protein B296_00012953 [Ensete ventricosum]
MDCRLKPLIQRARSEPPTSLYGGKRVSTSWTPSEGRATKGALMSSFLSSKLLSKPSPSSSRSSLCFSSPSPPSLLPRSVAFPFPKRSRCRLRLVRAQDSDTVASGDGDPKPQNGNLNMHLVHRKRLYGKFMQELASSAGEDVVFAMNTFIKRLLSVSDPAQMKV